MKRIAFLDSFYQLVHHGRTLVAVYGNPSHLPEQDAQREEEPFLLHQKARLAAYGRDEQFPDNQVPVGGVRGRADDALLEVGHIHFRFPAQQFVVDKPADGLFHAHLFGQFFQFFEHAVHFGIEVGSQLLVEQFHAARFGVADAADDVVAQVDNLEKQLAVSFPFFRIGVGRFYQAESCCHFGDIIDGFFNDFLLAIILKFLVNKNGLCCKDTISFGISMTGIAILMHKNVPYVSGSLLKRVKGGA